MYHSHEREVAVFEAALELPPDQRRAYLEQECSGDPELRMRVETLLNAQDRTTDNFLALAAARRSVETSLLPSEKAGDRIGPYKLLQQIGEGGCGIVYMAEQQTPIRRRVALKIIKLGMDTRQVIARFEAEQQAIALMDHPNIAKVYDAGATETGRPYFAMELIRGLKITDFCDQRNLTTQQRLELFIQVCQAVQHAHQKGIIHRDLKPSNILITVNDSVPVPKVIDFGIAKATNGGKLTDKTVFTAFEQFIGTPAYMSPEQADISSVDIDTRSDIYSLGVLLYELLTGQTPFDTKELLEIGLNEMRRTLREKEPPRPSTRLSTLGADALTTTANLRHTEAPKLVHVVRGDLDWIAMKCLEKDRSRRYETANGLARDIQRHLNSEPILARPPSRLYEFSRTVRRHRVGFAAVAAVLVALLLGLGASFWSLKRARAAEQKAITEAIKSKQVVQFINEMLQSVGPAVAVGRDPAILRGILEKTAKRLGEDLRSEPLVEADLRGTLSQAYLAIGEYETAKRMSERSLNLLQKFPGHPLAIATAMDNLANARFRLGKLKEAEDLQRKALDLREKHQGKDHPDLTSPLTTLAQIFCNDGNLAEAEKTQRRVLAICQNQTAAGDRKRVDALQVLASILYQQKRLEEAEDLDRQVLELQHRLLEPDDPEIAMAHNDLATVLHVQGKFRPAELEFRTAIALAEKLLPTNHPARLKLVGNLAFALSEQGKLREAEDQLLQVLEAERRALGPKHPQVATTLCNLGRLLHSAGRLDEAESTEQDALAMRKELLGVDNISVGVSLNHLTAIFQDEKKLPEAELAAEKALALYLRAEGPEHRDIAGSLYNLAAVLLDAQKLSQAEIRSSEAHAMYKKLMPEDWRRFDSGCLLGAVLLKQAKPRAAETLLLEGYHGMESRQAVIPLIAKKRLKQVVAWLVELYETLEDKHQAAQWKAKLIEMDRPVQGN